MVPKQLPGGICLWELKLRAEPHCPDPARLDAAMRLSRSQDFQEYFNSHRSMAPSAVRVAGKTDIRLFPEMPAQQPVF